MIQLQRQLPLNIPVSKVRNYELVIDKGYDTYIKLIYTLGSYITFKQFYSLYSKFNRGLSESYCEVKANSIIKELELINFIEIDTIAKYKYFYLKAPALAIAIGDYKRIPRTNHKNIKNTKLTTSIMKVEYYLKNDEILVSDTMYKHLKAITKTILEYTKKNELDYSVKFLESIITSSDYVKINEIASTLPKDDIIYIVWVELYGFFLKLHKQGQTISTKPLHFKVYINNNKLKLHYIPEIIIYDTHKIDYYQSKMNNILNDLLKVESNNVDGLRERYTPNVKLGDDRFNIIGYGLKLIGNIEAALERKVNLINSYGEFNNNSPFVSVVSEYIDISIYFRYNYSKKDVVEKIDEQVENIVNNKLSELL